MVPGFVQVGAIAVAAQIAVIAALSWYLRTRQPLPDAGARRRTLGVILVGSILVAGGQLLALGSTGSLWVADQLALQQAVWLQEVGFTAAFLGFVLVAAGLVWHGREATRRTS